MRSKIQVSILFLCVFSGLFAQENNFRDQILSYKDSDYNFINKGRRLLIENLQNFKMEEALNVKNGLLNEFEGSVTEVFYNGEYIHLLFWTEEFDELLNYLKQVDFNHPVSNNVRISAQTDNFYSALYTHTVENKDILEIEIKNAGLNDMERDFLLLLLHDIANPAPQNDLSNSAYTETTNDMADRFLALYPGSPYEAIVREQIRMVFKESDWGFYIDIGLGAALFQGDISRQFGDGAVMDMLFEYRHRKLMGILGFGLSGHSLRQYLPVNNTEWEKGASATLGNVYLNAGYLVFENRRWSIYPYMGAGYTGFSANEKDIKEDENLEKLGMGSFFTQAGVGIDLKIRSISTVNSSSDSRISLKYTYRMPRFERKAPLLPGSLHLITLSYGLGGRGSERDL